MNTICISRRNDSERTTKLFCIHNKAVRWYRHKAVRRFSPRIGYADVMGVPASRPILTVAKHGMERICDSLVLMS
jgi:hypothetical protein